jgi:dienelactone hydrolase
MSLPSLRLPTPADGPPPPAPLRLLSPQAANGTHALLLLPAIAGVDAYIERRAAQLGALGYQVAVLDYYGRSGVVPDLSSPERIGAAVAALDDQQVLDDIRQSIAWLAARGVSRQQVGLLGYCIGGSFALLAAAQPQPPSSCAPRRAASGVRNRPWMQPRTWPRPR